MYLPADNIIFILLFFSFWVHNKPQNGGFTRELFIFFLLRLLLLRLLLLLLMTNACSQATAHVRHRCRSWGRRRRRRSRSRSRCRRSCRLGGCCCAHILCFYKPQKILPSAPTSANPAPYSSSSSFIACACSAACSAICSCVTGTVGTVWVTSCCSSNVSSV